MRGQIGRFAKVLIWSNFQFLQRYYQGYFFSPFSPPRTTKSVVVQQQLLEFNVFIKFCLVEADFIVNRQSDSFCKILLAAAVHETSNK